MKLLKIKCQIIILLLISIPILLYANGGGIYYSSGISSGNISFVQNEVIILEKENLSVVIDGDIANVSVKYKFINIGEKKQLLYGFPVTSRTYIQNNKQSAEKEIKDSIYDFKMIFNDSEIKTEKMNCSIAFYNENAYDMNFNATLNRLYTATLEFPRGDSTLEINYRIQTSFYNDGSPKGGLNTYSNREFLYILSPSGNWGNGIVKEFAVSMDFTKAVKDGNKLTKIEGLKLKEKDSIYTGIFKDFNMLKAKPLFVSYNVTDAETRKLMQCDSSDSETDTYEYVKASSSLKGFEPKRAYDCNPKTAWVEDSGRGGIGEWIEINGYLHGVAIVNGMVASKELFYKYSRIKKLRLELFYSDEKTRTFDIDLENKQYPAGRVNSKEFYKVLFVIDSNDGSSPNKAKITILDVYPGTVFRKVSISDIYKIFLRGD